MTMKLLTAGVGFAALAAAAPLSAQYGYSPYAPYGNAYGYYNNANITQYAASACSAEVQRRLTQRVGVSGILGTVLGVNTGTQGRVLSVTQVRPRGSTVRVRGLASTGRMAYNPYGYGYYGAVGAPYAAPADLAFKCDVDYRGRIRDVDITRR